MCAIRKDVFFGHLKALRGDKDFSESFNMFIDNMQLDGLMEKFYKGTCSRDCDACSYCGRYAKKAIRYLVPETKRRENVGALHHILDMMVTGELY